MPSPLSLTGKRWILKRPAPFLSSDDIPSLLARERGIQVERGAIGKLSDPSVFAEMSAAVERIERAIAGHETVGIFGDYDADGITGVAQLVRFFRRHGVEPITHLPDRLAEGYGLRKETVDSFVKHGVTLLITVDTGVTAHEEIAAAKVAGIDVIVTDHHRPRGGRPPAFAVLHPEIPSPVPNTHLCGSGVAFTLVRALEHGAVWEGVDIDVALATIGTIGDVVPLTGENRVLVLRGLRLMENLCPSPLREFIDAIRSPGKPLTAGDIAFRLVPRINAAGRIAHPSIALDAILSGGAALEDLHRLNGERQAMVEELMVRARTLVHPDTPFITVRSAAFTPGVVGLIAGRLSEEYGRPVLAASELPDRLVCSLRSVPGIDVMECLQHPGVQPWLQTFGGHAQAAGCTILPTAFDAVSAGLSLSLRGMGVDEGDLIPGLDIESEIPAAAVGLGLARGLATLEPFGAGNEKPVFLLRGVELAMPRAVGAESRHLQCRVGGAKAIGFGLGRLLRQSSLKNVDIACSIGTDAWNGREEVQLMVEDVRNR